MQKFKDTFSWGILDSVEFGGGRLSLIARELPGGRFILSGVAWEDRIDQSFPRLVFGGVPCAWKESRRILRLVRKALHEIEIGTSYISGDAQDQVEWIADFFHSGVHTTFERVQMRLDYFNPL